MASGYAVKQAADLMDAAFFARWTEREAIGSLREAHRESKLYRALHHTYVQPAGTQEHTAELLDLPFSTFRRHLKAGVMRVTEQLWQHEVG